MFTFATSQAEERKRFLASACFMLIFFFGVFPCQTIAQEQEKTVLRIPGVPSFTPHHSIRVSEGEVLLFWGENRNPVHPEIWKSTRQGGVEFTVNNNSAALSFAIASTEQRSASMPLAGVIVNCTASSLTNQPANAAVWLAWRYQPSNQKQNHGMALFTTPQASIEWKEIADSWDETLTWWFQSNAFHRGQSVLYWIDDSTGWEVEQFVKDTQPPYRSVEKQSILGWTKLNANVTENKPVSFQLFIPYKPVPVSAYPLISTQETSQK